MSSSVRALHYVFKIGDRKKSYEFFVNLLGMKILRHEEFSEGCAAECNGPYNGLWSKTMVGYGGEEKHFVLELTYNYTIGGYTLGDDYRSITIEGDSIYQNLESKGHKATADSHQIELPDPDGHLFIVKRGTKEDITRISTNVQSLEKSLDYWHGHLKMKMLEKDAKRAVLSFGDDQASFEINQIDKKIDRKSAYGRIAFAYPGKELKSLEESTESAGYSILKPFVTLHTPGKADVEVVILGDPDEHEICFVGAEGFWELAQIDPKSDETLQKAMEKDSSVDWFKDGKKFV
ncbi:unnamed protein product, partial [Mesorhabditis belari]|uniref:VOC domain-containing protein n=1 Tax=Mesorhabditis belari TaxID=2138241 RepID=A0AAF3F226_9BILA